MGAVGGAIAVGGDNGGGGGVLLFWLQNCISFNAESCMHPPIQSELKLKIYIILFL